MQRLLLAAVATVALAAASPAAAITYTFNYTGDVIWWTAPQIGTYEIVAIGAQGGGHSPTQGNIGGLGALVGGRFWLDTQENSVRIIVGGMGGTKSNGGGGGGGTFVSAGPSVLVAGGGGGNGVDLSFRVNANTGPEGLDSWGLPLTARTGPGGLFGLVRRGGPAFDYLNPFTGTGAGERHPVRASCPGARPHRGIRPWQDS